MIFEVLYDDGSHLSSGSKGQANPPHCFLVHSHGFYNSNAKALHKVGRAVAATRQEFVSAIIRVFVSAIIR
jgi:hypothetical protein